MVYYVLGNFIFIFHLLCKPQHIEDFNKIGASQDKNEINK